MSSSTWTPAALSSEARPLAGQGWRFVEAQHYVSTLKLTDTLEEQALLEELIEETKPLLPPECRRLNYLLAAPFRYQPYPSGSRFRRAGLSPGVFYAAETPGTAAAEIAFYRLLFFAESPATPWPSNPAEFTAFAVAFATTAALDLTRPPLDSDAALWTSLSDYAACQALTEAAREAGIELIRYRSVRDPQAGANLAILHCSAFAAPEPVDRQTWRLFFSDTGVRALCEFPRRSLTFSPSAFATDPRLATMVWSRPG